MALKDTIDTWEIGFMIMHGRYPLSASTSPRRFYEQSRWMDMPAAFLLGGIFTAISDTSRTDIALQRAPLG